ncbi:MAG: DUF4388 domain-containing protein [Deltaproteobacteria bacterium]|nr:DUF4388 domain-containing protein [Deltaproteobacteria bacterium]
MSVALRGNLADFGIGEVFQLIGQQRKTGVLEISNEGGRIQLCFDAGSVVSAAPVADQPEAALGELLVRRGLLQPETLASALSECAATLERLGQHLVARGLASKQEVDAADELLTRETIFDLLRQSQGSFHFTARPVVHDRDPAALLGAEQILMDGLRMVDEWRTLARNLPSEDVVLRRKRNFSVYAESASGEASRRLVTAERIYLLVDGRLTLRRVIDLSHLGTFEASRIVADLLAGGVIEPVRRREVAPKIARGPSDLSHRAVLAAAVVLAGLAIIALALHLRSAPAASVARVSGDELVSAHRAFEERRLHNALDAFRAARGVWPDRLDSLVEAGLLDPTALTSETTAPYYYRRSADGVVLLSPER